MYHVGTGWYCWEALQAELGLGRAREDLPLLQIPQGKPTPSEKRKQLRLAFSRLYRRYRNEGDPAPILRFVRDQLRARRMDVVIDALVYLSEQKDKKRTPLLRRIVMSRTWQTFARSLKPLERTA